MSICRKHVSVLWLVFLGVSTQLIILRHPWRWRRQPVRKRRCNYKSTRNHVPEYYNLQNERCEELKLRKYKFIFDDDTKERSHQNYASKREYLSSSHTGHRNFTRNYVFILLLSIRTENGACHVVISAQTCTTFVFLYFCHFHRKSKSSREQTNHVATSPAERQALPKQWDVMVRSYSAQSALKPNFLLPLYFIKKRTEWDFLREPFPLSTLTLYFLREFIWTFML